jgi:hypothetical protein
VSPQAAWRVSCWLTARAGGTRIDVDVCRAVAAAIFGDAEQVKYVPMNGTTVCVPSGSTTELNLGDDFPANKMTLKPMERRSASARRGITICQAGQYAPLIR